ncbi:MAG: hypothetical protein ABI970_04545, partial [Chloroflexota bacterium]
MFKQVFALRLRYNDIRSFLILMLTLSSIIFVVPKTAANSVIESNAKQSSNDPVIAAAGDIACDPASSSFKGGNGSTNSCHQKATSNLMINAHLSGVLALGDTQYYCGSLTAYLMSYNLSWGRLKSITHPSIGNHEYLTSGGTGCAADNTGAAGYFSYFGTAAGNFGQAY